MEETLKQLSGPVDALTGSRNTVEEASRKVALVVGDVAILLVFSAIGRASHGEPLLDIGLIKTAAPFIAGWLIAGPLTGAYASDSTSSVGSSLKATSKSWLAGFPLGLAIRSLAVGYAPPAAFAAISAGFTFVMLNAWRAVYAFRESRAPQSTTKKASVFEIPLMVFRLVKRW